VKPQATSREDILAACRRLVREGGLEGVSVRAVATAAGVAPGTLYHYFPDKRALLTAVTADVWREVFDLDALPAAGEAPAAAGDTPAAVGEELAAGDALPAAGEAPAVAGEKDVGFPGYVRALFSGARLRLAAYPGFAQEHGLDLVAQAGHAEDGRRRMDAFLARVERALLAALARDGRVSGRAFADGLTPEALARVVMRDLLALLVLGSEDCDDLVALLRSVLYRES